MSHNLLQGHSPNYIKPSTGPHPLHVLPPLNRAKVSTKPWAHGSLGAMWIITCRISGKITWHKVLKTHIAVVGPWLACINLSLYPKWRFGQEQQLSQQNAYLASLRTWIWPSETISKQQCGGVCFEFWNWGGREEGLWDSPDSQSRPLGEAQTSETLLHFEDNPRTWLLLASVDVYLPTETHEHVDTWEKTD